MSFPNTAPRNIVQHNNSYKIKSFKEVKSENKGLSYFDCLNDDDVKKTAWKAISENFNPIYKQLNSNSRNILIDNFFSLLQMIQNKMNNGGGNINFQSEFISQDKLNILILNLEIMCTHRKTFFSDIKMNLSSFGSSFKFGSTAQFNFGQENYTDMAMDLIKIVYIMQQVPQQQQVQLVKKYSNSDIVRITHVDSSNTASYYLKSDNKFILIGHKKPRNIKPEQNSKDLRRRFIGSGSCGSVYKYTDPQLPAVKKITAENADVNVTQFNKISKQLFTHEKLRKNFAPLFIIRHKNKNFIGVMPYVPGKPPVQGNPKPNVNHVSDFAQALQEAHKLGRIIGDNKPENFILDHEENMLVRIDTDFEGLPYKSHLYGTPRYLPPNQRSWAVEDHETYPKAKKDQENFHLKFRQALSLYEYLLTARDMLYSDNFNAFLAERKFKETLDKVIQIINPEHIDLVQKFMAELNTAKFSLDTFQKIQAIGYGNLFKREE